MRPPRLPRCFTLAPDDVYELNVAPELAARTGEVLVGDRNYWSRRLEDQLHQEGVTLHAPFGSRKRDPGPSFCPTPRRQRYRIDTLFRSNCCPITPGWRAESAGLGLLQCGHPILYGQRLNLI